MMAKIINERMITEHQAYYGALVAETIVCTEAPPRRSARRDEQLEFDCYDLRGEE